MKTNVLVAKEVRLLLPAWFAAMLLAIVPVWLLPYYPHYGTTADKSPLFMGAFLLGMAMLAMSSFGREFAMKTFPLLLSLPSERPRAWRTKTMVLAGAIITVYLAWALSSTPRIAPENWLEEMVGGMMAAVAVVAGGLCMTLLVRQIAGAIWLTILLPGAMCVVADLAGATGWIEWMLLFAYAVTAFLLARWQFLNAQEVGWTGGTVALPGWHAHDAAQAGLRSRRPLAALITKEIKLQQLNLLAVAGLFLLHLGVVMVRYFGGRSLSDPVRAGLEVFGGLWFLMPLLFGGASIAEERNLGTMQAHLALPVSRRVQFALKLLMVLLAGGLLSATLLWTAEGISGSLGVRMGIEFLNTPFHGHALFILCSLFLGWSLICFYSSSLVGGWISSFAASVLTVVVLWLATQLIGWLNSILYEDFGFRLWYTGFFLLLFLVPGLIVTFIRLGYGNFKNVSGGWRLWRGNILVFVAVMFGAVLTASAIYNRTWELLGPAEPAHGAARMALSPPPILTPSMGSLPTQIHVLMPDGRIWADQFNFDPGRIWFGIRLGNESLALSGPRKWHTLSGNCFLSGSNWVDSVATASENMAIRDDGTLWVSEQPRSSWRREDGNIILNDEEPSPLVQVGTETNWRSVVPYGWGGSGILLKQDGTLWRWSAPIVRIKGAVTNHWTYAGLRSSPPHRLGTESNWERIIWTMGFIYAWKDDGQFWRIYHTDKEVKAPDIQLEPDMAMYRERKFDGFKFKSIAGGWIFGAGLAEDGSLWVWNGDLKQTPIRLGNETNWTSLACDETRFVARKTNGSLWAWSFNDHLRPKGVNWTDASVLKALAARSPTRLGTHTDWLAVVGDGADWPSGVVALAADGSLWHWWPKEYPEYMYISSLDDFRSPRKPSYLANIFKTAPSP